jgi:2-hydroxy-3-oxopropionate reductase
MAEKIGFIGLGIMGKPMARNLANAGHELVVHNRSRDDVDLLLAEGPAFSAADSPADVARQCEIVITMLPDSPEVEQVVFGDNGLIGVLGSRHLLVDMSTIAPATSVRVYEAAKERGAAALDAPVSGGDKGAIAGTLSIMVGGDDAAFQRALPVFEAMGKTIVHVGGAGAGQIVKACNQIVVAINYAAVSEALVLGAKAGVDPAKVIQVLSGGLAASRVMEMRGPTMVSGEFAPGFRVNLHRKDLGIALATGRETGVPMPVTAIVGQLYDSLAASGKGDLDHSSLVTLFEQLAGASLSGEA